MAPETCVEIAYAVTEKVPLQENVTMATAMATAQARALELAIADDQDVLGVAIIAGGRRIDIGGDKLAEWGVLNG